MTYIPLVVTYILDKNKYNQGMAKHMQCVQAIPDCMKKGKAEYHNVIGPITGSPAVFDVIKISTNPFTSAHAPSHSGLLSHNYSK